jgi:hypothetical protein
MIRALGTACSVSRFRSLAPPSKRWPARSCLRRIFLVLAALNALPWPIVCPSQAASLQPQELRILAKALNFLEPPLTGQPVVAVVYAPGDPKSRQDAEDLAGQLNTIPLGGVPVVPRVIGRQSLATEVFQLVIAADGADGQPVIAAAQANHALCVTANVAAVLVGQCTMAIRSSGKVEIFVNKAAAAESGIGFATAFRMMVHEQ